jgi:hypothetical protein
MNERVPDRMDPATLADLDAGLPDDATAAALRRAARGDPRAAEVLNALAATRADLADARDPDLPADVAARWTAALAAERARPQLQVHRLGSVRRRVLLVAAAAAAVVVGVVGVITPRPGQPALAVSRVDLVAVATSSVGTVDVGALADPGRRDACLRAVLPAAAGERLLGGRPVVLDGRPGVLLVLATGTRGGLHVVTVDPDCGPAGGTLLAQVTVG